jgi:RNA polymerase sigma factor (sigma-70 family)
MMGYNILMERRSDLISWRTDDPDLSLVRAIARGDARALEELYNHQGPGILAYLFNRLGDRELAEEILQDVMLAVWQGAGRFRGKSRVRTWMLSIARYKAINAWQRSAPVAMHFDEELPDPAPGPSNLATQGDALKELSAALLQLPDHQRETLELVFNHQLSCKEAAKVMGVSPGTVKSRLHRAKASLRKLLGSQEDNHA